MNTNYQYFLSYIKRLPNYKKLRILDYGCGSGGIVKILRVNKINCYGIDIYHKGVPSSILNNEL